MSKNFAEHFVYLRRPRLAPKSLSEAGLYHTESGFAVRPLVIMPHVLFTMKTVQVKDSIPCRALGVAARVRSERNVRLRADALNEFEVTPRRIGFICAHFTEVKVARRVRNK